MRVVINQWTPLGAKSGIGHYIDQLLHHLGSSEHEAEAFQLHNREADAPRSPVRHHPPIEIEGFPATWLRRGRDLGGRLRACLVQGEDTPVAAGARRGLSSRLKQAAVSGLRQMSWKALGNHLRFLVKKRRYDLYHEPNFIPLPSDCPTLTTIHDLSVVLHPQWHPADRVAWFERRLPDAIQRSMHFLTISDFGRSEVVRRLGISPEKVTAIYLGVREGLAPLPEEQVAATLHRLGLPRHYLLHVGTIEPRKNLLMLMQAYCSLPRELRAQWPLILVGSWGWNTSAIRSYYHEHARHQGVIQAGYVPDKDLAALYNGARALLCSSWYEGLGLPPLEMLACGGAVLASTAGALTETLAGQVPLIDPSDQDGWRSAMVRVLRDDSWWLKLRSGAVEHAAPFTWRRCAAKTLAVYRRLCSRSVRSAG